MLFDRSKRAKREPNVSPLWFEKRYCYEELTFALSLLLSPG